MHFIDLQVQYQRIKDDVNTRIQTVLDHGQYIMGPEIAELEAALADTVGVKHAIVVSSGTDALILALMALDVGPGCEVITTPFSFISTASVIKLVGAKPVFVDIDPKTYNISPDLIESSITDKTKAILPVNLYGQCADMDGINEIADRYGLSVIEDAAQSLGATYKGSASGSLGLIGCTSFYPAKPLGGYGEGGACFTHSDSKAQMLRSLRNHGQKERYQHAYIGLNGRMDSIQAAVLLAKLPIFQDEIRRRKQIADNYTHLLPGSVQTPYIAPHNSSAFAQYTIEVNDRQSLQKYLHDQGIPTAIHYPKPLHLQPAFADLGLSEGSYPVAERASHRVLSLPMYPYLTEADQHKIIAQLAKHQG